jgi:hypothetical protein
MRKMNNSTKTNITKYLISTFQFTIAFSFESYQHQCDQRWQGLDSPHCYWRVAPHSNRSARAQAIREAYINDLKHRGVSQKFQIRFLVFLALNTIEIRAFVWNHQLVSLKIGNRKHAMILAIRQCFLMCSPARNYFGHVRCVHRFYCASNAPVIPQNTL